MNLTPVHNFLRALMMPLAEIDKALPKRGKMYDLGCGEGVVAKYIAQNRKRSVVGVDLDEKRLDRRESQNLRFEKADIRNYNLKSADGVVLTDVLHHISFQDQQIVLENISKSIKKDGVLVIKEIDTSENIRSKLSRFWDFVFYPNEKIYFSNSKDLSQKLAKLGFRVTVKRLSLLFPGSTTLFICKK